MLYEHHQFVEIKISWRIQSLVPVQAFLLSNFHSFDLQLGPQGRELLDLLIYLIDMVHLNWSLATWAAHERERNS